MRRLFRSYRGTGPVLAAALVLSGCSSAGGETAEGPVARHVQAREVYHFDNLAAMVATSDLVVVAETTDVNVGRQVGQGDEAVQLTEATLRVETVLFGAYAEVDLRVEVDELLAGRPDAPRPPWLVPGARSLLFLHAKRDREGYYRPTNSQGVLSIHGNEVTSTVDDELTGRLTARPAEQLIRDVLHAADAVRAGTVAPQRPALPEADLSN
jgi:hypothetical protein